jgi:periplasmic divalent cation tolerance protein
MIEAIQIVTTFSSKSRAEEVARELVRKRLIACGQVSGPIISVYRWHETIETGEEWTLTMKTRRDLFDAVAEELRRLHSYEVPEILATPIVAGSESYLRWMGENLVPIQ